jgi:trehalose synthase
VVHVNATPYGGGVSELLRSLVPIYRGFGIDAQWQVITGDDKFFGVTKAFHNALQGAPYQLTASDRDTYLMYNTHNAQGLEGDYDFVFIHDPQPLPMRHFAGARGAKWIWRCHIDTSEPNTEVLEFLTPYAATYDAVIFTLPEFVPPAWRTMPVTTMPPGIDPLSPKNMSLPQDVGQRLIRWLGVEPGRPILTQVSRFDPWKDPLGVINVYRAVREEVPDLQLALLGSMAMDDPEGWDLYNRIRDEAGGDPDIHVATNITGVSNMEVNAFHDRSDVVIQKSIREGFGLVVSETLWKGTPVVAGNTGGIPIQMPPGIGGFLVDDPAQYPRYIVKLLKDRELAKDLAEKGRRHVQERFLITRLLADELRLLHRLKSGERIPPLEA